MITQAEWEIMRVLWHYKQPINAYSIYEVLEESLHWTESTVKTLLARLVKKQYVSYSKQGKQYLYVASVQQEDVLLNRLLSILDDGCNKDKGKLVLKVLQTIDLTKEDATQIITTLENRITDLPITISCHCKKGQCQCK